MFERLDLPPLVLVLLLLYGLFIAFVYMLWTALNLRRRQGVEQRAKAQSTRSDRRAAQPVSAAAAEAEQVKPWLAKPAAEPRRADSETVASYSVRKKSGSKPDTRQAPPLKPVRSERTEPEAPPAARERRQPEPVQTRERAVKPPAVEANARVQEHPRSDSPATPAQKEERARNEDAFARFLRSSGEDRDDY